MKKYVGSFRFILDILSLLNLPTYFSRSISEPNLVLILNLLGMLKISRYFRAQTLIVQSRITRERKALSSCGFYFVLLLIYLHMMGCLFFFACLKTYTRSSKRISVLDDMGMRTLADDGVTYNYLFDSQ